MFSMPEIPSEPGSSAKSWLEQHSHHQAHHHHHQNQQHGYSQRRPEQQKHQEQRLPFADRISTAPGSLTVGSLPASIPQGLFCSMSIPDTELVAAFQSQPSDPNLSAARRTGSEGQLAELHRLQPQQPQQKIRCPKEFEHPVRSPDNIDLSQAAEADHQDMLELFGKDPDAITSPEPSRILIIRNVAPNASVEELKGIFESFGDVRTLVTDHLLRGFVLVSYFDLRVAMAAKNTLQGTLVSNLPLDIHYSSSKQGTQDTGVNQGTIVLFNLDPDTTNEHLAWLFFKFGTVKDVRESPKRESQKFVTFYDVRHAAAAMKAMNCAENLGKLPGHITPQQAASLAHIAGSAASQGQLAGPINNGGESSGNFHPLSSGHMQEHLSSSAASCGIAPPALPDTGPVAGPPHPDASTNADLSNMLSRRGPIMDSNNSGGGSSGGGSMMPEAGLQGHGGASRISLLGTSPSNEGGNITHTMSSNANLRFGSQGDLTKHAQAHPGSAMLANFNSRCQGPLSGLHLSDSASSIAAAAPKGQFFSHSNLIGGMSPQAFPGVHSGASPLYGGHPTGGMLNSRMAGGNGSHGIDVSMYNASQLDRQAQQLLVQSGMSHAEAANALMSLNLSGQPHGQPQQHHPSGLAQQKSNSFNQMWPGGYSHSLNPIMEGSEGVGNVGGANPAQLWASSMFGNGEDSGSNANALAATECMAALASQLASMEVQQRQQQQQNSSMAQQQMHAQMLLAQQLACMQAQQASITTPSNNHLVTAQHLLQAAQLNQALAQLSGAGSFNQQQASAYASSMAAAQLLQQAGLGFGMPGLNSHLAASQTPAALAGSHNQMDLASLMSQLAAAQQMQQQHSQHNGQSTLPTQAHAAPPRGAAGLGAGQGLPGQGGTHGTTADGVRSGGRLSRRTTDPMAEAERKAHQEKLYALNNDRIRSGEDKRTTLMIKNIPNKYTQKMLLTTIDEHFRGTYDFFYLPIDFKNKCNVGYAFINMLQPLHIIPLVDRFNGKKWERFNSEKVCHISYARIQGRSSLVSHFQNSSLMHEDKRCRPILFSTDGIEVGEQEPFPVPAGGMRSAGGSSNSLAATGHPPSAGSSGGMSKSSSQQKLPKSASSTSLTCAF